MDISLCPEPPRHPSEVAGQVSTIAKIVELCEVQSLAVLYFALRDGLKDAALRDLTDEVVRTTLQHISTMRRSLESVAEDVHRG